MVIRLVAFDLDGTLIRGESCVDAIARELGRSEECAAFERLSMRDVEPVTAAREEMASWIQGYPRERLLAALSGLTLAPGSEQAFTRLRAHGIVTAIVSITWRDAVEWFGRRLGADHVLGTRLRGARIEHVWPADKGPWLNELAERSCLGPSQVAAVGDSEGDREMLGAAGSRFFVGAAVPSKLDVVHVPDGDILDIADRILAVR